MIDVLRSIAFALALTILLELLFIKALRIKAERIYITAVLVNIMTNPLVNSIYNYLFNAVCLRGIGLAAATAVLETAAVMAEWAVYKKYTDVKRPFLLSFGANSVSFLTGIVIQIIF